MPRNPIEEARVPSGVFAQSTPGGKVSLLSPGMREWRAGRAPPSPRPVASGCPPCSAAFSSVLTEAFSP
eukprot:6584474-Pyramimonas_sp.AAC.1